MSEAVLNFRLFVVKTMSSGCVGGEEMTCPLGLRTSSLISDKVLYVLFVRYGTEM